MLNEANMDVGISGSPHSVVKHAQSTSVRELIQKIENHPDRHVLRQDFWQNQAYYPLSPESKKMIQEVGNIELFILERIDMARSQETGIFSRRCIYDRFIRDEQFRKRMNENDREEDACRQWDDFTNEDHTPQDTMLCKMITVLTRYRPIVLELI